MAGGSFKAKKQLTKIKTRLYMNLLTQNTNTTKFMVFSMNSTSLPNCNDTKINKYNCCHTNKRIC